MKTWEGLALKSSLQEQIESDESLQEFYEDIDQIVSVMFNNGNGIVSFAKINGKWYFLGGF